MHGAPEEVPADPVQKFLQSIEQRLLTIESLLSSGCVPVWPHISSAMQGIPATTLEIECCAVRLLQRWWRKTRSPRVHAESMSIELSIGALSSTPNATTVVEPVPCRVLARCARVGECSQSRGSDAADASSQSSQRIVSEYGPNTFHKERFDRPIETAVGSGKRNPQNEIVVGTITGREVDDDARSHFVWTTPSTGVPKTPNILEPSVVLLSLKLWRFKTGLNQMSTDAIRRMDDSGGYFVPTENKIYKIAWPRH